MFAFAYLLAMVAVGDAVASRFLPMRSVLQRLSAAVLVGLLLATWLTYIASAAFSGLDSPMVVGNAVFFAFAAAVLRDLPRRLRVLVEQQQRQRIARLLWRERRDFAVLGVLSLVSAWLAVSTYTVDGGVIQMSELVYSDFGTTTALSQSFAVGNNFPTVLPHFPGEPIRYHFLFYFAAGNLAFLGLDPALGLNLLSVLSMGAMLGLVIVLGRLLFRSAAVGWIGAALFFVHGSLSWLGYVASQPSVAAAISELGTRRAFLPTGFPYRGEDWGTWSMNIYANQRHFASGIGVLLLVLVFLVDRWRRRQPEEWRWRDGLAGAAAGGSAMRRRAAELWRQTAEWRRSRFAGPPPFELDRPQAASFLFAGLLLGALPMWNGAVFVAAFVVMAALFVLLPDRRYMLFLAAGAAIAALPQLDFVRPSGVNAPYPAFHWGYVVDEPTPANVAWYFAVIFGPKIVLAAVALAMLRVLHLKVFVAGLALVALALTVRFSAEILVNHKFLNMWLVLLNLFAGYSLWRLWQARPVANLMFGRLVAAVLVVVIAGGGIIDLMPFKNSYKVHVAYRDDRLADWVTARTQPDDIFLTYFLVTHPILVTGRSVFIGWPYNAGSAGYDVRAREQTYRQLFTERDPALVTRLLHENDIDWVVWDDGVRSHDLVADAPNEDVYTANFPLVFEDTAYGNVRIYEVP